MGALCGSQEKPTDESYDTDAEKDNDTLDVKIPVGPPSKRRWPSASAGGRSGNMDALTPDYGYSGALTTTSTFGYDDATLRLPLFSHSVSLSRRTTLSYIESLDMLNKNVQMKIAGEVTCMTWNMQDSSLTNPFEYYNVFKGLIGEKEDLIVRVLVDVAQVFFSLNQPAQGTDDDRALAEVLVIGRILPDTVLQPSVHEAFITATGISGADATFVRSYGEQTLRDFLRAHNRDRGSSSALQKDLSFPDCNELGLTRRCIPINSSYKALSSAAALKSNQRLLPAVILDMLQLFVINFTMQLLSADVGLTKAFSEHTPREQRIMVENFLNRRNSVTGVAGQSGEVRPSFDRNKEELDKTFVGIRDRLWNQWNKIFTSTNKVTQLQDKCYKSKADIMFLQEINKDMYNMIRKEFSQEFYIVPEQWPDEYEAPIHHTPIILVRKATLNLARDDTKKIRVRGLQNRRFGVLCHYNFQNGKASEAISFWAAVVHLKPGENQEDEKDRVRETRELLRKFPRDPNIIIAGDFNQDLAQQNCPVTKILVDAKMNTIDHNQEQPLAYTVHKTRTNLQYQTHKADVPSMGVVEGVFSTFPLIGSAFTDFQPQAPVGAANPSDHGPIFQKILIQG